MNHVRPALITPALLHDQPLDLLGDRPETPSFNFDAYANTFARLIATCDTRTPLVLGISGAWGSGKTTLLKLIQNKLETTRSDNFSTWGFVNPQDEGSDFRPCRTVWFNAWKYADEDALLVALVRVIVQAMADDDIVSQVLGKLLDPSYPRRDVVNTVLSWFSVNLGGVVEFKPNTGTPKPTAFEEKAALLDQFSEAFDRLTAAWIHRQVDAKKIDPQKGVLVIFIDDLDRCLHDKAVQVLEAIKLFLDRPGVVFVLAADEGMIEAAIRARFKTQEVEGQRAQDYVEKFFQVRFVLPPVSKTQAGDYLVHALSDVDERLVQMVLAGAEVNPRQIKTFINYLNVGWAVLVNSGQAEGVVRADFARWLALTRAGPRFCDKVRELPIDRRLDYLADAAKWAADPTYKPGEYQDYAGGDHRRLRNVLKLGHYADRVTAEVLDGFIFWSAPEPTEPAPPTSRESEKTSVTVVDTAGLASTHSTAEKVTTTERWITIPAGKFVMGSREDDKDAEDNERPQHTLEISYDYRIGRFPVTNAEFKVFVEASSYELNPEQRELLEQTELRDHPVVNVSWRDALAYCNWLTQGLRTTGAISASEVVRLPTEAEWEKAARGEYGKQYPWGDEWDPKRCNNNEKGSGKTTPVGAYSPQGDSPFGVTDMAGNVFEWCQSELRPYPYAAGDGREELTSEGSRVLRGGSFSDGRRGVRCAYRYRSRPVGRDVIIGFRVVVALFSSRWIPDP